jgi:predicted pyridoxine 5'-phosphate oxidase superfamily flavin-nucleotide-binding protein
MAYSFGDVMFTKRVRALQEQDGSRAHYARMQAAGVARGSDFGSRETEYLQAADHFFLASVSENGRPYVQHRGGPRGFIRVLGPRELAFADFRGNRQHVTEGNVAGDDRVAMIVMDYARQMRLKLAGRVRFLDAATAPPPLLETVSLPGYAARIERIAVLALEAFDWNCPQHLTPRYTIEEIEAARRAVLEPAE